MCLNKACNIDVCLAGLQIQYFCANAASPVRSSSGKGERLQSHPEDGAEGQPVLVDGHRPPAAAVRAGVIRARRCRGRRLRPPRAARPCFYRLLIDRATQPCT